ncbi:MAG: c-type cytochrome [Akkermansiaceae bacterium]|jgi:cytochrome c553|tara:strand:- start:17293 stop:17997 length:705 start_codon:yes stop_codon:yes gene_type:complete
MKYTVAAGFVLLGILAWLLPPQSDENRSKDTDVSVSTGVYQTTCATCHGEQGEGRKELMTPSIASLPRWYIEEQIQKFRNGQRGNHPKDLNGQKMRAAIGELSEVQISEALDFIETLPALSHASTLQGDAERGYQLYYDNCMACHRFNGHGEVVFKSSSLNGLQDWYLLEQLTKFEKGIRGYHKHDESGVKMREAVSYISSKQDKIDILALLSNLAKKYPVEKNSKSQTPKTNQ